MVLYCQQGFKLKFSHWYLIWIHNCVHRLCSHVLGVLVYPVQRLPDVPHAGADQEGGHHLILPGSPRRVSKPALTQDLK